MSFGSAIFPSDPYRKAWPAEGEGGLVKQLYKAGQFLRGIRVQMRFGELTRAPLRLLRLQMIDDVVEFVQVQVGQMTPDQVAANDPIQGIIGLLQSGLGIVTGITFLKWIYRAYKNIQGFGAEGLRFSPGWAVGYYFIPILSLIRPVQVMSEIWRASDDPRSWKGRPGSWLIASWWTLFLLYTGITQVSVEIAMQASTNDQWTLAAVLAILGDLFSIPLSIAALRLVTEIYRRQKALVEGLDSD